MKDGNLYVTGSNANGTAYGIMELSRMLGVSPWVWWADRYGITIGTSHCEPLQRSTPVEWPAAGVGEYLLEYCMDLAWDKELLYQRDSNMHLKQWLSREFGEEVCVP